MTPQQIAAREQFRTYLGETYGADKAALMMNIAELESNFDPTAKAKTTSASGLMQITSGHWATLANHIKVQVGKGLMDPNEMPAGMTLKNIDNFDEHKFDELASAYMTAANIDYIGSRYVAKANRQRSALGKPPVANMAELTKGNYALEAFMVAGGHKDGPGVHDKGKLVGTGFGAGIKGGEISVDALFDAYAMNRKINARSGEAITDGQGHGLTYAMYASDNVAETAGGPKMQLNARQIKKGMELRATNVRADSKLMAPWLDRAQQIDPGFEPDNDNFDAWLPRLDLADPVMLAGANDIETTTPIQQLRNPALPRYSPPAAVAMPEVRSDPEDPVIAARMRNRMASRTNRDVAEVFGKDLEFLIPPERAAADPGVGPDPLADPRGRNRVPTSRANNATASDPTAGGPRGRNRTRNRLDDFSSASPDVGQQDPRSEDQSDPRLFAQPIDSPVTQAALSFGGIQLPRLGEDDVIPGGPPRAGDLSGSPFEDVAGTSLSDGYAAYQDGRSSSAEQQALADQYGPAFQQYQDSRNFANEQSRLERIVNGYNEGERMDSAALEQTALARAAEMRAQDEQDLAIALTPEFTASQTPLQEYQRVSLSDFALPQGPASITTSNVAGSNKEFQRFIDQGRQTDLDYQIAAARQVVGENQFGSINDYINRARGTNFEEQQDQLALETARTGLEQINNGTLTYQNMPELLARQQALQRSQASMANYIQNRTRAN